MRRSSGSMMLLALGLPLVANLELIGDIPTLAEGRNTKQNTLPIRTAKLNRKKANVAARKVSSNYVCKVGSPFSKGRSLNKSRNKSKRNNDESEHKTKKNSRRRPAADGPPKHCTSSQSEVESELELTSSHSGKSLSDPDYSSPDPQLCAAELTLSSQKVTLKNVSIKPASDSNFVCTRCGKESACTDNNIQRITERQYSPLEQNNKDGDACLARTIDKQCMASSESQTTPTPMNKTTITSHSIYNTRKIDDENLFVHGTRTLINAKNGEVSDDENSNFLSDVKENTTILPECPTKPREAELGNSEPNQPSGCNDQLGSVITLGEVEGKEDKTIIIVVNQKSQINLNNSHLGSDSVANQDDEIINIPHSKHGSARSGDVKNNQDTSKKSSTHPSMDNIIRTPSKRSSFVANQEIDYQQEKRIKAHHDNDEMNDIKKSSTNRRDTQPRSEINQREGNSKTHLDVEDVGHQKLNINGYQDKHNTPSFPRYTIKDVCVVGAGSRCCDPCESNRILALLSQGVIQCEKRRDFANGGAISDDAAQNNCRKRCFVVCPDTCKMCNHRMQGPHYCEDSSCQSRSAKHYDDRSVSIEMKTCTPIGCHLCLQGCSEGPSGRICIDDIKPCRISTECQNASTSTRDEQHEKQSKRKSEKLKLKQSKEEMNGHISRHNVDNGEDVIEHFVYPIGSARKTDDKKHILKQSNFEHNKNGPISSEENVHEPKESAQRTPQENEIFQNNEREYYVMLKSDVTCLVADDFRDAIEESYKNCNSDFSGDVRKDFKDYMADASASDSQPRRTSDFMRDAGQESTAQPNDVLDEEVSDDEPKATDIKRRMYRKITVDPRDIIEFRKMHQIPLEGIESDEDVDSRHSEPLESRGGSNDDVLLTAAYNYSKTDTLTPECDKNERSDDNKESYNSPIDHRVNNDIENNVDDTDILKDIEASLDYNNEEDDHQNVSHIDEPSRNVKAETNTDNAVSNPITGSSRQINQDDADDGETTETRGQEEVAYNVNDDSRSISDLTVRENDMSEPVVTESNARTDTVSNRTSLQISDIEYENRISHSYKNFEEKAIIAKKVSSVQKTAATSAVQSTSPSKVTSRDTNQENTSFAENTNSAENNQSLSKVTIVDKADSQETESFTETEIGEVQDPYLSKVRSMHKTASKGKTILAETMYSAVQSPSPSKIKSIDKASSQEKASFTETAFSKGQSPSPSKVISMDKATSQKKCSFKQIVYKVIQRLRSSKVTSMDKATSKEKAIFAETMYSAVQSPSPSKVIYMDKATGQDQAIFAEAAYREVKSPNPLKVTSMDKATSQKKGSFTETVYTVVQRLRSSKVTSMDKAIGQDQAIFAETAYSGVQSPSPSKVTSMDKAIGHDQAIFAETAYSEVQSPSPSKVTSMDKATGQEKASFTETAYSGVQSPSPSKVTSMNKAIGHDQAIFAETAYSGVQSPSPSKVTSMDKATGQEKASFTETGSIAVQSPSLSKVTSMHKATSKEKAIFAETMYSAVQSPSPSKVTSMDKATGQEKASFTETENNAVQSRSPSKISSMHKATSQEKASFRETEISQVQGPSPSKVTSMDKAIGQDQAIFAETAYSGVQSPRPSKVTSMDKATSKEKASFTETEIREVQGPSTSEVTSMHKARSQDKASVTETEIREVQGPSTSEVTSMDKAIGQDQASFAEISYSGVQSPKASKVTSMDKATSKEKASFTESAIIEVKGPSPSKAISMDKATSQDQAIFEETVYSGLQSSSPSKVTSMHKAKSHEKASFTENANNEVENPIPSKDTSMHKAASQDKAIFADTAYSGVQSPSPSKVTSMHKARSQDKASVTETEIREVQGPSTSEVSSMDKATGQEKAIFAETSYSAVQGPSPSKVISMDKAIGQDEDIFAETAYSGVQSPRPSKVTSMDKATSKEKASFTETAIIELKRASPSKAISMDKATGQDQAIFAETVNSGLQSSSPSKVTSMDKVTGQDQAIFAETVYSGLQSSSPSKVTSTDKVTGQDQAIFEETVYSGLQSSSPSKVTSMHKAKSHEKASFTENANNEVEIPIPSKETSMHKAESQDKAIFADTAYSGVQSPSPSKVTSMHKARSQDKASVTETEIREVQNRSLSKVTSMDKATGQDTTIFEGTAYSAVQSPSPSKARIMEKASSTEDAVSPQKLINAKKVKKICRDDNPEGFYTEIGQTLYALLSRVDHQNVTEDESADRLTHAIDFLKDLIQADLCLTRENYDETSNVRGGSDELNNLSRTVSNGDVIDKFKSLIESSYKSIGDTGTIIRENNKVMHLGENGSTVFYFYDLFENKGVIEQNMLAKVVSRYDVACDVVEDFKLLWDEMDIQTQSTTEVGAGNVHANSRRRTSKRDFASSVLDDFEEEIMQRVLTTACQTEQAHNEASEETELDIQDHISSSSMSLNRESRTENREVGHQSSADHDRRRSLLNEKDLYDEEEVESPRNVAKTKSGSLTEDDDESQYIDETQKITDEDSGPDEIAQLSMHEEIPLSHNDLRELPAVESTENVSVANVGAARSVSLQEEEMFNESAHHRPGKQPDWHSEVELRSSVSSSAVREGKSHRSRSDEERKHRSIKVVGDGRRSRTSPEYRDNGYNERSSHKYHDDVDRGSERHTANEDQRRCVSPSGSQNWQHTRSRNDKQQPRPNSDTYVQKRITTSTGPDDRLAYRPVENCRGKCSRDGTPRSQSPVFHEENSTNGPPKSKALSRPVSPEEVSDDDDEHVSKSPYGYSRGRSSGAGNKKSCKCQTDFDDSHPPQKQTSDCEARSKPQNYIEESRRILAERINIRAACEAKGNREFFRSKTIIPPWQTRGSTNLGRCCGNREDRYRLADRQCYSSRKYERNAARPIDYQQRVDCVGSSPNHLDAAGPSSVSSCFARTIIPTCPPTGYLGCVQNKAQPLYVQPQGNCMYPNYEMPVRYYTEPVALSSVYTKQPVALSRVYTKQPVALSSVYTNQPVAMPCNCVNQPEPLPLFNNCPQVEIPSQACPPVQMAGFYKENCHDGSSRSENYISQGCVPAPAYFQERRVPRAWFKRAKNDDTDST